MSLSGLIKHEPWINQHRDLINSYTGNMSKPIRILGIAGSLRRESYNRAALRAATELVSKGGV